MVMRLAGFEDSLRAVGDLMGLPSSKDFLGEIETLLGLFLFSVIFPGGSEGLERLLFWSGDFRGDTEGFEFILLDSFGDLEGKPRIFAFFGDDNCRGLRQIVSISVTGTSFSISLPRCTTCFSREMISSSRTATSSSNSLVCGHQRIQCDQ